MLKGIDTRDMNLTERLLDISGRLTNAEAGIKSGQNVEEHLRTIASVREWSAQNKEGLDAVMKARTKTPLDAELQARALDLRTGRSLDTLHAVGMVELRATQTPADVISIKIPGLINQAKAILDTGDTETGKKLMDEARTLIKDNEQSMRLATSYTGNNPLAQQVKESAAGHLSMKWYTDLLPLTDKRTNPAWTADQARKVGWGQAQKSAYDKALYSNDLNDRAVYQSLITSMGGAQMDSALKAKKSAASKPGAQASGTEAAVVQETNFDPESYINYASAAWEEHIKPLGLSMSSDSIASFTRGLAEFDLANNGAGLRYAAGKVKEFRSRNPGATPDPIREKDILVNSADAFRKTVEGYAGRNADVTTMRQAGEVFAHLTKDIPADAWNARKADEVSSAATDAGAAIGKLSAYSPDVAQTAGHLLAGALLKFRTNGKMDKNEERVYNAVTAGDFMSGTIDRLPAMATKDNADLYYGFEIVRRKADAVVSAVTADALANGKGMNAEMLRASLKEDGGVAENEFVKELKTLVPGTTDNVLRLSAKAALAAWSDTGKFNAQDLPVAMKAIADAEIQRKISGLGNPDVPGAEKAKTFAEIEAGLNKFQKEISASSADATLLSALRGADLRGSTRDLTPGEADVNAVRDAVSKAWSLPKVEQIFKANTKVTEYVSGLEAGAARKKEDVAKEIARMLNDRVREESKIIASGGLTAGGEKKIKEAIDAYAADYASAIALAAQEASPAALMGTHAGADAIKSMAPAVRMAQTAGMPGPVVMLRDVPQAFVDAFVGGDRGWQVRDRIYEKILVGKGPEDKKQVAVSDAAKRAYTQSFETVDRKELEQIKEFATKLEQRITTPFKDRGARDLYASIPKRFDAAGISDPTVITKAQAKYEEDLLKDPDGTTAEFNLGNTFRNERDTAINRKASLERQQAVLKKKDLLALEGEE